jgi:hypothetical protein
MWEMAPSVLKTYFKSFTTDNLGRIDLTGVLNVRSHDTIKVEICQCPDAGVSMTVQCDIGKISGSTPDWTVAQFPLGNGAIPVQTFNVVGPEFRVILTGGPANTKVPIQGRVFLH